MCVTSDTLFNLKSGLTYDLLGLVSGMDASNAKRNQDAGLAILGKALGSVDISGIVIQKQPVIDI